MHMQPVRLVGSILGVMLAVIGLLAMLDRLNPPRQTPADHVTQQFRQDLTRLEQLTDTLRIVAERSSRTDSLQRAFLNCRTAWKRIEPLAEYYFPATSRLVNGPPLPEVEVEENKLFQPEGLQVIEEHLYPAFDPDHRTELVLEIRKLRQELRRYVMLWDVTKLTDAHVFDALRLEIFRIIALGISGFDTPACQTAMPEAATALATVRTYLAFYGTEKQPLFAQLQTQLRQAETYLMQHPDFDTFDRAQFITMYANPLSKQLMAFQRLVVAEPIRDRRPLRSDAETLFAVDAFDPDAYAATVDARMNPAKIELGRRLFFDPVLSVNNQRSCASCHQPQRAFTDGLPKNKTLTGAGFIGRNTPTLLNVALQAGQFYDLRATSLESQSFVVIHSPDEMHGSLDEAVRQLRRSPAYVALFQKAFPQADSIDPISVQNALAAYERTLLSFDSRFDHYMRGNKTALSTEEIRGFNLFMGKAKCGICHFVPLFNGTVPPNFTDSESEVIGTPATSAGKRIDPDPGRYGHTKLDILKYAFKTPTLRNVARTAPYMHNGAFATLDEVVDFYDKGGGNGLGFGLDNQTLPEDKLNLTGPEKRALVAFMNAL